MVELKVLLCRALDVVFEVTEGLMAPVVTALDDIHYIKTMLPSTAGHFVDVSKCSVRRKKSDRGPLGLISFVWVFLFLYERSPQQ